MWLKSIREYGIITEAEKVGIPNEEYIKAAAEFAGKVIGG